MAKKKLKNLAQSNSEGLAFQSRINNNTPVPNGVACPDCGEELYDSQPMVTLTSHPAQKSTHCGNCEYTGFRFV